MQRELLLKKLQDIGLTPNEARVYLAALETGLSPVAEIAKTADLNRVTTYSIWNDF